VSLTLAHTTPTPSHPVTELLARWNQGDVAAREALVPIVYQELHRLAGRHLARRDSGQTLEATALVHEAYLRLAGQNSGHFADREHFFAVAAKLMRNILIDHARMRDAAKRGRNKVSVVEDLDQLPAPSDAIDLLGLNEALNRLAAFDPTQATIVELRFFAGLSIEETALALHLSPATVKRQWLVAKTWIRKYLESN
jgi:RNA polymerase sigma factor (TIGR02999 family)